MVEEGTQARGYRHHLAIPGGGGGRPVLSVYRDGDLSNCPQPRGARRDGCLILPFGNRQELSVLRDGDGKFFTENPLLGGPYSRLEDVFRAASLLFRDRTQTQVVAQDGRPNRPRGARQCSSLVLTRYRPRNRPRRTRRAPSPALTEDLRLPPLPSESDKLVVAATAFASGLTLLEPDVSSSDELLDTTSSELITASAQTVPHNTTDGSPSGHCYSASSGPTIWVRNPPGWYFMFFVRMDRGGSFHMYPDMGGPFRSLKEAEDFIDRHIDKLRRKAMCNEQDDLPYLEKLIRRCVFYPDGTPKRGPNAPGRKNPNYRELQLVQAILDQYNDDHSLFGDFAHELNSDISFQWIPEATTRYYHFNFTTKTKEAGDVYRGTGNLFFAEVSQMQRDGDWVLSCCRMIEPSDNGQCYGCSRDESPDIKHPNNSNEYAGGHENKYMGFGGDPFSDSDDDEEAQVAKLRRKFKGLDRAFNKEKTKCGNEATLVKS